MLLPEQIQQIKRQIIEQINSSFPEDKKESAKQQIDNMNPEQLEEFLKQNNLIKSDGSDQQCIFCSIISGNTKSYQIEETKDAIAILEINPISKAHVLVIPKKHISSSEKLPKAIINFAEKIAKKIKSKFKPKNIIISQANLFGHEIINVLPVYENETLNSKRNKSKPKELEKLQNILKEKPKPKIITPPKIKKLSSEKLWLPKRIP